MSSEHNSTSQTVATRTELDWGRDFFEYDPEALVYEMSKWVALKIINACPDSGDVSALTQAIARRGVAIFNEKLKADYQMWVAGLVTKAMSASFAEHMSRTLLLGAGSADVAQINSQLHEHVEAALFKGHREIWGDPKLGRTPASDYEKQTHFLKEKSDLERGCLEAMAQLRASGQKVKKVNVARKLYCPAQNIRAAQVTLARNLKRYQVNFQKLARTAEDLKQLAAN